jgi:hypothetical protein
MGSSWGKHDKSAAYRRRPWWRRYTIQNYRVWRLAYRLGLTKEPW